MIAKLLAAACLFILIVYAGWRLGWRNDNNWKLCVRCRWLYNRLGEKKRPPIEHPYPVGLCNQCGHYYRAHS